ncbi:MAG: universal stress protein [Planctomycetota bacterium]|jgi:nucleotide-binding universal stress UspA family protein
MTSPQRIVVGVDASSSSENAVLVALRLAERFSGEVELVHAVEPHAFSSRVSDDELEAARRAVRLRLEGSLPGALVAAVREPQHLLVQAGHAATVVLERAAVEGTGLVVLGGHRRKGLLDLHKTAHLVISRAECPVWTQEGPVRDVHHILVPVDLSDESLRALSTATAWAAALGARVTALHCFVPPEMYGGHMPAGPTYVVDTLREDARQAYEDTLAKHDWRGVVHEAIFHEADPATQVLEMQEDVDLVMMGTHGRTGLAGVILGNVAQRVLREAHVPVVTMRSPGRSWLL